MDRRVFLIKGSGMSFSGKTANTRRSNLWLHRLFWNIFHFNYTVQEIWGSKIGKIPQNRDFGPSYFQVGPYFTENVIEWQEKLFRLMQKQEKNSFSSENLDKFCISKMLWSLAKDQIRSPKFSSRSDQIVVTSWRS